MTDIDQPGDKIAMAQEWLADVSAFEQRRQSVFAENRAALFDALERSGIALVTVNFDGYGDSGQTNDIVVTGDDAPDLETINLDQKQVSWGTKEIRTVTVDLGTAIEDLAYVLLEQTHGGWGNGEGAYGEFVFDVAAHTIVLDFNERHIEIVTHWHEL